MNVFRPSGVTAFPSQPPGDHVERLNDPERLSTLDAAGVMDTAPEEGFDRMARMATAVLGVPVGLVSFVDAERQFFKAECGLPGGDDSVQETPLSHSFCQYVVTHDRTLAVTDAREHPLLKSNKAITDLGVIAYLGVPIHAPNGQPLGSFCAIDSKPRLWSEQDVSLISDLAAMIETELLLKHEHDAMQTLAREMNHRVKNLFSVVGGMISLTARSAETPMDMARVLQGRLSALDTAHSLISPALAEGRTDIEVQTLLGKLIARLLDPHVAFPDKQLMLDLPELLLSGQSVTDLALVIHELATNAAKYGALSNTDGTIDIRGAVAGDMVHLTWRERGGPSIGQAPANKGFGSKLIDLTVSRQMNGAMETTWHADGVEHLLSLPLSLFDTDDCATDGRLS